MKPLGSTASAPQVVARPGNSPAQSAGIPAAIGTAVALALLSAGPVAWSFLLRPPESALRNSGYVKGPIDWQPMAPLEATALAIAVVVVSAAVGGFAGGLIWRWRRFAGAAVALASAWGAGIMALPVAAAVLGVHLRTGIVCLLGCEPLLRDDRPFGGPYAYANFFAGSFFVFWNAVAPVLVVLVLARVLFDWVRGRPAGRPRVPLVPSVALLAVAHGMALIWLSIDTHGGIVPYLLLSAGIVVWTARMERMDQPSAPGDIPAR